VAYLVLLGISVSISRLSLITHHTNRSGSVTAMTGQKQQHEQLLSFLITTKEVLQG